MGTEGGKSRRCESATRTWFPMRADYVSVSRIDSTSYHTACDEETTRTKYILVRFHALGFGSTLAHRGNRRSREQCRPQVLKTHGVQPSTQTLVFLSSPRVALGLSNDAPWREEKKSRRRSFRISTSVSLVIYTKHKQAEGLVFALAPAAARGDRDGKRLSTNCRGNKSTASTAAEGYVHRAPPKYREFSTTVVVEKRLYGEG